MLTEKDYCDYDTCVALKEVGYIGSAEECAYFGAFYMNGKDIFYNRLCNPELYDDKYLRVPLYLAQKWLRKEKRIEVVVLSRSMVGAPYYFQVYTEDHLIIDDKNYDSHEEALSEGIKEAVKILKAK